MVSTPPKSGGSPAEEAWRRWAEENITGLIQGDIVRDTRVKAVIQAATNVGNSAANAAAAANTAIDSASGIAPTNRVARPLTERAYWIEVTTGKRKVWTGDGIASTASNASAVVGGIMLTTSADIGAEIDLTPLLQLPASGRLRVGAQAEAGSVNAMLQVTVRDAAGQPIEGITQPDPVPGTGATIKLPKPASGVGYYTVKAYLPADSGSTVLIAAEVFEVIGSGTGMIIGPDGIAIEDPNGDKTFEFNPSAPLLPAPTPPTLTTGVGQVSVKWDGALQGGGALPARFSYVRAEEATSETGMWIRTGQSLNKSGTIIARPQIGMTMWYRLIAVDTMNRESEPSAPVSIVVGGVAPADLDTIITDAIDQASSDASEAKTQAAAAQATAGTAQSKADQAAADAAAAAGLAAGKGKVIIQPSAPDAADRLAQNLWIDTTGGANTPKRWNGSAWVAVTDKAATDAAAAAATAQTRADQAFTQATTAATAAGNAQTSADAKNRVWYQNDAPAGTGHKVGDTWFDTDGGNKISVWNGSAWTVAQDADIATALANAAAAQSAAVSAQTTANGKNRVVRSTSDASSPANYAAGDQWWKYSGAQIVGLWIHDGSAWVAQTLTDSVITNLDAGTITAGTLGVDRLGANSITAAKMAITDFTNMTPGGGFDSPADLSNWIDTTGGTAWIAYGTGNTNGSQGGLFVSGAAGFRLLYQTFPVREGEKYRITWDTVTTSTYNGTSSNGKLRLGDGNGSPGSVLTAWAWGDPGTGWNTRSYVYTIPTGVRFLSVALSFDHTDGTVKIDNFSVRRMGAAELLVDGSVTADAMAANSITAANGAIADLAVTDAKIANVDAAKITTGYLDVANRIRANSIATSQLLVSNLTNLADDPSFEVSTSGVAWAFAGGASWQSTNARTGTGCLYVPASSVAVVAGAINSFQVEEGEQYRISGWVRAISGSSTSNGITLRFMYGASADNVNTASADIAVTPSGTGTTYTQMSGVWTVPAGAKFARPQVIRRNTSLNYLVDDVSVQKMSDGSLIVDGAIDGKVITGATVRTAASGQRVQLDADGLKSYNSSNQITGALAAGAGGLTLSGTLRSGAGNQRAEMASTGLNFFSANNIKSGEIWATNGGASVTTGVLAIVGGVWPTYFGQIDLPEGGTVGMQTHSLDSSYIHVQDVDVKEDLNLDGRLHTPHLPYAMAAGVASVDISFPYISFPAGRFTQPPMVVAQLSSGAGADVGVTMMVTTVTTTSFRMRHTGASGSRSAYWQAVQMTPTSGAG